MGDGGRTGISLLDPRLAPFKPCQFMGSIRFPPTCTWQGRILRAEGGCTLHEQLTYHLQHLRASSLPTINQIKTHLVSASLIIFLYTALVWKELLNRMCLTLQREALEGSPMKPNMQVLERLHDARVNLDFAIPAIDHSITLLEHRRAHPWPAVYTRSLPDSDLADKIIALELDFRDLLSEANRLETLVTQYFNTLMSTLSLQESQRGIQTGEISLRQSSSMARLTQLAFLYVPLSFVTGVFGMNIQEINDTGRHIWAFFPCDAGRGGDNFCGGVIFCKIDGFVENGRGKGVLVEEWEEEPWDE